MSNYFQSELGQQCKSLFSTPDDRVFIRYSETLQHCTDNNLDSNSILEWFEEWSGTNSEPKVIYTHDNSNKAENNELCCKIFSILLGF